MKTEEPLYKKNVMPLLIKLLEGRKKMSELLDVMPSYTTIKSYVSELENKGYVKTEEKFEGRKIIYVELTPRGKVVAEALKKAQWLANLPPEKIERFAQMKAFIHINTYEDHVTLKEIQLGESRIINVYVKPKGNLIYFYCDYDKTDDCEHVEYLFADPEISDYVHSWISKNGYKLAKKYQKYADKYW